MSAPPDDRDPVYQSASDMAPDSAYEAGDLRFLVAGNRGRLLDVRRTPVSVIAVRPETGFVILRVDAFEDAGATWQIPLEAARRYQFERGSRQAPRQAIDEMRRAVERFDRALVIEPTAKDRDRTREVVAGLQAHAATWLAQRSRFLDGDRQLPDPATRRGEESLAADLEAYLRDQRLWDIESVFARQYVSNPASGEIVKGHCIVLAELGLATYAGTVLRDPAALTGRWSRERRADHIRNRLAFLRALFAVLGVEHLTLWRGVSADTPLRTGLRRTFISTSFDETVARSHFEGNPQHPTRVLVCQAVPIERLFQSYLETGAMNDRFLEAEALLMATSDDGWP